MGWLTSALRCLELQLEDSKPGDGNPLTGLHHSPVLQLIHAKSWEPQCFCTWASLSFLSISFLGFKGILRERERESQLEAILPFMITVIFAKFYSVK